MFSSIASGSSQTTPQQGWAPQHRRSRRGRSDPPDQPRVTLLHDFLQATQAALPDSNVAAIRDALDRAGLGAKTAVSVESRLHAIMASAVADEVIDSNPCRIRGAGQHKRAHKVIPASVAQLNAAIEAMTPRLKAAVALASWCAPRRGEVLELRRADIDLEAGVVRVRRTAGVVNGQWVIGTPKSTEGIRDVTIPPHLLQMIANHLAEHVGPGPDALLFPGSDGGHLQPGSLYREWYKAREAAGRQDLRFHDLRHSGAVLAAATGATLAELMQRLGHATPSAALLYQHVARGRDQEIAAQLSKIAENG